MAKKILIADDELHLVEIIKLAMEIQGFEVITAFNGTEALAKALEEKPDLILLDVIMPGLAGYQVFDRLQTDPHAKHIPIFVISARKNMAELFPQSKLITFFSKPLEIEVLVSKITQALELQAREESKDVLIYGVQEFVAKKIQGWFTEKGYNAMIFLNEYDAIQKCEILAPKFFLCQFWDDSTILDSASVYRKVKYGSVADKVHFYIYCPQNMFIEAQKSLPLPIIMPYTDSRDLLGKIKALL